MTLDEFIQAIANDECPSSLTKPLQALWYAKKGDWDMAHEISQNASDADSAWVHAYLHRKEGDLINARYWYGRSGQPECKAELDAEWDGIVSELLMKVLRKLCQISNFEKM